MGKSTLGELEQLVLMAALRLRDEAYAVTIRREVLERARRDLTRGTVYVTLQRLEEKGFLGSTFGEPTSVRGGKAKKFYAVTPQGLEALTTSMDGLQRMAAGLGLLGDTA